MNIEKNNSIKLSLKATKARRKGMKLKVYTLKFDKSHLSNEKLNHLNLLFTEAKWYRNFLLGLPKGELWRFDTKIKTITSLDKNGNPVQRDLSCLSSQMRQSVLEQLKQNIINLSKSKAAGIKIGKLKFKSKIYSIDLKQPHVSWRIDKKYIKIQGCKKSFKVEGTDQLKNVREYGQARLVSRNGDFYLKVTCYEDMQVKQLTGKSVGIDFGIKTTITTSDNQEFNIKVPLTKRHKALSRKFHLKPKGTKNRKRVLAKLNKEDEKITNRKKDKRNKVVSELKSKYDVIVIQKDCIKQWQQDGFGKEIHNSAIGGIIEDIQKMPSTLTVDRWYPSTQECYVCKKLNKLGIEERIYQCSCGNVEKRDVHSAKNILREGFNRLRNIGDSKMPVELNPLEIPFMEFQRFGIEAGSHCSLERGNSLIAMMHGNDIIENTI